MICCSEPHSYCYNFRADLISNTSQPQTEYWVENWTKWRLYLGKDMVTVHPHQQMSMEQMVNTTNNKS